MICFEFEQLSNFQLAVILLESIYGTDKLLVPYDDEIVHEYL